MLLLEQIGGDALVTQVEDLGLNDLGLVLDGHGGRPAGGVDGGLAAVEGVGNHLVGVLGVDVQHAVNHLDARRSHAEVKALTIQEGQLTGTDLEVVLVTCLVVVTI